MGTLESPLRSFYCPAQGIFGKQSEFEAFHAPGFLHHFTHDFRLRPTVRELKVRLYGCVCVCKIVAGSSFCLIVVVSAAVAAAAAAAVFEALGVGVQFSRRRRRDRLRFSPLESHLAALRALQAGDSDSHSYAEF